MLAPLLPDGVVEEEVQRAVVHLDGGAVGELVLHMPSGGVTYVPVQVSGGCSAWYKAHGWSCSVRAAGSDACPRTSTTQIPSSRSRRSNQLPCVGASLAAGTFNGTRCADRQREALRPCRRAAALLRRSAAPGLQLAQTPGKLPGAAASRHPPDIPLHASPDPRRVCSRCSARGPHHTAHLVSRLPILRGVRLQHALRLAAAGAADLRSRPIASPSNQQPPCR
jgi:hypothetical protein